MASETGLGLGATASSIYSNQGLIGFYKGNDANIMRAIVNNGTKMACYDQSKSLIKNNAPAPLNDGVPLQALASFVAGFFMTCTVAPFDICRTRLMNQPADKPKIYNNLFDTFVKIATQEGPLALWRGGLLPVVELDGRLITDSVSIMLALEREFGGDRSLLPPGGVDDIRDLMGLERQLGSAWLGWLRAPPGVGGTVSSMGAPSPGSDR